MVAAPEICEVLRDIDRANKAPPGRRRKDAKDVTNLQTFTMRAPISLLEFLSEEADARGVSTTKIVLDLLKTGIAVTQLHKEVREAA